MTFDFESPHKKLVKQIFKEIDEAMENTKSKVPVTMEKSEFLKLYLKIKEKYENLD